MNWKGNLVYEISRLNTPRRLLSQLKKMDKRIAAFILSYIEEKLVDCENPRLYGKALQGGLNDKWAIPE